MVIASTKLVASFWSDSERQPSFSFGQLHRTNLMFLRAIAVSAFNERGDRMQQNFEVSSFSQTGLQRPSSVKAAAFSGRD